MARTNFPSRNGATTIEFALVIPIYLTIISAVVMGGISIFQKHQLTLMAKYLARQAIVHGQSADRIGSWGPGSIQGSLGDGSLIGTLLANKFSDGHATNIYYRMRWPDGGNDASRGDRVEVTIASFDLSDPFDIETGGSSGLKSRLSKASASVTFTIMH
jgi:hypothetical protein